MHAVCGEGGKGLATGQCLEINQIFSFFVIYFRNFSVSFRFGLLFSLCSLSFRFYFPSFRLEAKNFLLHFRIVSLQPKTNGAP
jgi:hypothetical protein